jgi:signal transduction histidine kinase
VLAIASRLAAQYQPADCELMLAFANQIAATVDNAQLFETLEDRERDSRLLYEITRLLVSLDQEAIPLSVMNKLGEVLPIDVGGMLLGGSPPCVTLKVNSPVEESVLQEVEARLVTAYNALSNDMVSHHTIKRHVAAAGSGPTPIGHLASRLSVPLLIGRNVIGVIELGSVEPAAYSESELRTLFIIANSTATSLENARLYQELVSRATHLQHVIDELADAYQLKDELVQNLSHELRTPLTYIVSYAEMLLTEQMGSLNADQQSSLQVLASKAQMIARLLTDILSLDKRISANIDFVSVNLSELAQRAVQEIRPVCDERGLSLVEEIDPLVAPVLASPVEIEQVLSNLLDNAIKFNTPGGSITIRVKQRGRRVRVEIEDTGIGIAEDKLGRVFERFYQVDGTPRRRYGGIGLGLAICKKTVEAHHGYIGVTSLLGSGSTFYFELPKAKGAN